MNRKQQDLAWSVLPKEFKEEVKKMFQKDINTCNNMNQAMRCILVDIFGLHNLTSDAEGEEMLTVSRKDVVELYQEVQKTISSCKGTELAMQSIGIKNVLWSFFGSNCLPDDTKDGTKDDTKEPKPAGPKFKVGDKVKIAKNGNVYNNSIGEIIDISSNGSAYILFCNGQAWFRLTDLEPYTEPEEESRNLLQETANCDKHFDNIPKDSFRNERRLNIATQIMSSILSNQKMLNNLAHGETTADGVVRCIVNATMMYTDALIAECELTETDTEIIV